jgi:hypothetical protein
MVSSWNEPPALRTPIAILWTVLGFATCVATGQTQGRNELADTVTVATNLKAVRFGVALEDWRRTHPSARCGAQYPNTSSRSAPERPEPEGDWCTLCEETVENQTTEWTFYPLRADVPIACRLEHVRVYTDGPSDVVNQVHDQTVEAIASEHGHARQAVVEVPNPGGGGTMLPTAPQEFGTGYWKEINHWPAGEVEIYAYIYADDYRHLPPRATVWMRDGSLRERLREETLRRFRPPVLADEVSDSLRRAYPEIAATLRARGGVTGNARQVLLNALQAARRAPGAEKALLLLAADRLSYRAANAFPAGLDEHDPSLKVFADAGLTFEQDSYSDDGRLTPTDSLLNFVSNHYANSRWGDRATVELLHTCDNDTDRFRSVIQEGTRFLAARPQSRYRLDVMFALGLASETWWSLSQAVDDEFAKAEDYVAGAEDARLQAIRWYEKVVGLSPGSDAAFEAHQKAVRLSLRLDTGQRAFSCPYP